MQMTTEEAQRAVAYGMKHTSRWPDGVIRPMILPSKTPEMESKAPTSEQGKARLSQSMKEYRAKVNC